MTVTKPLIGLVLSGGGARGAYEAGVIHFLRTGVPQDHVHFDILAGTSVGAINACFLAATAEDPVRQGKEIRRLWASLTPSRIYKKGAFSVSKALFQTLKHDLFNWLRQRQKGESSPFTFYKALQDTSPLREFITREIPWPHIAQNLRSGQVGGLTVSVTNVQTGQLVIFLEQNSRLHYYGTPPALRTSIHVEHAMASAAIPLLFPTIEIDGIHYCDGGLRQTTPISPAVALGAEKVLIISLRYNPNLRQLPISDIDSPSLGHIAGKVFNAIFLDHLEYDLKMMKRMNRIIDWSTKIYGEDYLDRLNEALKKDEFLQDIPQRGLHKIDELTLHPSEDIGKMTAEFVKKGGTRNLELALWHRLLFKTTQAGAQTEADLLSYLLFDPTYLNQLFELGFEDARRQKDNLIRFFEETVQVGRIRHGEVIL